MTDFELITVSISLLAVLVAFVSLYRTRKTSEIQIELEKINAKLAEKQLERILEGEDREDQPIFSIRVMSMIGLGNRDTPDYTVKIKVQVDNTGVSYLAGKHIVLVTITDGKFLSCPGAHFDHLDPREHDPILGEREIIIKSSSKLTECKLHIIYIDKFGNERIQEYSVFPEGSKVNPLPRKIYFKYEKIYQVVPSTLWTM